MFTIKKTLAVLLTAFVANTSFAAPLPTSMNAGKHVFGYFTNYSIYDRGYNAKKMPIQDLTAVIYAFAQVGNCAAPYATEDNRALCNASGQYGTATGVQDYKLYSTDAYADFKKIPTGYKHAGEDGKGTLSDVIKIAHAQQKPVLLSIGGYTLSAALNTAMDNAHRKVFIDSIVAFLNQAKADNNGDGFDGVDIDWEPHDWNRLTQNEIADFAAFLKELRSALQKNYAPYAWVTIATWADPAVVKKVGSVHWQTITNSVDFINVMTYDYHGAFDVPKITNLQAPLTFEANQPQGVVGRETFNIEKTMAAYLEQGIPANKLIVGFPSYGRAVSGVPNKAPDALPKAFGLYQTFNGVPKGQWDAAWDEPSGLFDYRYIVSKMLGQGYTDYEIAGTAAAFNPSANNGTFISYDNVNSVKAKAKYVKDQGFAGLMTWELSGDLEPTDPNFNTSSLIHAAKVGLN